MNSVDSHISKIFCIYNPNSGPQYKKRQNQKFIIFLKKQPQVVLHIWDITVDFTVIAKQIKTYQIIVAIGGDGSINRIAQEIIGTKKVLGIIPLGSGNGLARTLGISRSPYKAWNQLKNAKPFLIDVGMCNDNLFLCTSGIGFDAEVARLFSTSNQRGLFTYIKLILTLALKYKPKNIKIEINGAAFNSKVFMATCCNAGQFGNNFYIAPDAKLNDGELNLVIIPAFNFFNLFKIILSFAFKTVKTSNLIIRHYVKTVELKSIPNGLVHIDGEVLQQTSSVKYSILPGHLYVLK